MNFNPTLAQVRQQRHREGKGQTESQGHAKLAYMIEEALETSGAC